VASQVWLNRDLLLTARLDRPHRGASASCPLPVRELGCLPAFHLAQIRQGDVAAMGQQLRALSVPVRPVGGQVFAGDFERRMSRYGQGSMPDIKLVMSAAVGVLRDRRLRLDPQLTLALTAVTQAPAVLTCLARRTARSPMRPWPPADGLAHA
jgi:hypothetical protein